MLPFDLPALTDMTPKLIPDNPTHDIRSHHSGPQKCMGVCAKCCGRNVRARRLERILPEVGQPQPQRRPRAERRISDQLVDQSHDSRSLIFICALARAQVWNRKLQCVVSSQQCWSCHGSKSLVFSPSLVQEFPGRTSASIHDT